ncbi:dTDP-4-amino-4,6-dideoxygalactose transaminase [Sulfitobacter brevis]|uniref:dTDP-4-amino-4,6-dideoxygalactose transaminase n=1 Tax=Sulfitobacter brevis TaxID=74348 RepID=A0A1I2FCZ5_9RHOB|nr:DegT/DnrJ/EryC1/StrS family aminotransferase [Sulfitobacter brevis]SFF03374.1 dTDP-4-amino-4,6-dideoxygalactose transaminase [Sulfitobacter brevis]
MAGTLIDPNRISPDQEGARAPLYVARPLLPELSDLNALLEGVWATRIVTNEAALHNRLEAELSRLLRVPVAKLFSSGTSALQCAMLALDLPKGSEVITTPLTFPATAHAISACGLTPVFADIEPDTLTIDPRAVEAAITPRTAAVLGVHVYGTICDVDALEALCAAHDLRLLFDAAHAFYSQSGGRSVATMGDVSAFSLHATKLYNTVEGGLATTNDTDLAERLGLARNFGIESEERVSIVGMNGKMSELHAAVGLLNLDGLPAERAARKALRASYNSIVSRHFGLKTQALQVDVVHSEQYYLLRVDPQAFGASRDDLYEALKARKIFARKYFWPICTDYDCYRGMPIISLEKVAVADQVKSTLLCLPFHSGVTDAHVDVIAETIAST